MTREQETGVLHALRSRLGRIVRRGSAARPASGASAAEQWQSLGDALARAVEMPAGERAQWLDRVGATNPALRGEIESLLEAHERSGLIDARATDFVPAVSRDAVTAAARDTVVAQYRILEWAGSGAMGVVYKAWDQRLERTVVLKFLLPHLVSEPRARERFRIEAQAAASLDHPNICTIYEVGEGEDGEFFIAMPWYEGETLAARIARGPLPVVDVVSLGLQAARGLAKAHERGIIHRDIKPGNLAITIDGVLKILDFGIAKLRDVMLTDPGMAPGTAAYMSPEQTYGDQVDTRSDLWSLGVVLHEMLAGVRPFQGDSAASVIAAVRGGEPGMLASVRSDVPPALSRLVRALLARQPDDRPASAADAAAELEAISAVVGAPASVAPPPRDSRGHVDSSPAVSVDGERRQATVVALRISGYADLLESCGTEPAERAIAQLRSLLEAVTTRHRGVVHRFDANGAMLLFGVPRTQEDDGMRAARAATELITLARDAGGTDATGALARLQLHVGLHTGALIAHAHADGVSRYNVAGAALDLANWLASIAPSGRIWVSPHCRRLLEPQLLLDAGAPVVLPGMSQPIVPYEVVGDSPAHTRLEAAGRQGELTPYTGRERELTLVCDALADACRGTGRFVTVVGDAGIGKSRLLQEFRQVVEQQDVTVLQGRCQSYGGAPYLPFIEVLRDALGLTTARSATERAATVVERVHAIAPELDELVPLYLHLLSVPSDELRVPPHLHGEQFRLSAQEAIAGLLTASSRECPTVLLLEDWHWVDDASHAVLSQVVELVGHHALLVVVTCRPGYITDWGNASPHAAIVLGPLVEASSHALLQAMLRVHEVPVPLGAVLHERTGGNPFFLEEICQTLLEDGTLRLSDGRVQVTDSLEAQGLPDTVQAVIRARLDRLDPEAREILRVASVVGREFGRDVLERTVSDASRLPVALRALKAAGVIQQMRIVPAAEYRFNHVLTQEVAYASLLEHQRRSLHGRVGEAIEALHDPLPDEWLERLAFHFGRAEHWSKAADYAVRAADHAALLAEFQGALQLLELARGWLARLPDDDGRRERLLDVLLRQERMSETLGLRERQQRLVDEMIALLEPHGDPARLAEVYVRQGDLHTLLRQFGAAELALDRSLRIRRQLGDTLGTTNTLRSLGLLRWHQGRDAEAVEHMEEALANDRERNDVLAVVGDLSNLGYVLKGLGMLERARACFTEGLELCDRTLAGNAGAGVRSELALKQTYLTHNYANVLRQLGDDAGALELLNRIKEYAAEKRLPIQLSYHYTSIAHLHLQAGRIEESLDHYRLAVELTRAVNFVPGLAQSLSMLGSVLLALGRDVEALPHLEEAAHLFAQLKDRETEARLWGDVARVHERAGRDADALACWSKARALRRELRDRKGELKAVEGLARVTRRHVSEPSFALSYYQEAVTLAAALGDRGAEGRLRNVIGILEWGSGRHKAALEEYEATLSCFRLADDAEGTGLALNSIGATQRALGRRDDARRTLEEAVAHNRREGLDALLGYCLAVLGDVETDAGQPDRAARYFEESLAIRMRLGDVRGEGWMRYELARVATARGGADQGRALLATATKVAEECGDAALGEACDRLRRTAGM